MEFSFSTFAKRHKIWYFLKIICKYVHQLMYIHHWWSCHQISKLQFYHIKIYYFHKLPNKMMFVFNTSMSLLQYKRQRYLWVGFLNNYFWWNLLFKSFTRWPSNCEFVKILSQIVLVLQFLKIIYLMTWQLWICKKY